MKSFPISRLFEQLSQRSSADGVQWRLLKSLSAMFRTMLWSVPRLEIALDKAKFCDINCQKSFGGWRSFGNRVQRHNDITVQSDTRRIIWSVIQTLYHTGAKQTGKLVADSSDLRFWKAKKGRENQTLGKNQVYRENQTRLPGNTVERARA